MNLDDFYNRLNTWLGDYEILDIIIKEESNVNIKLEGTDIVQKEKVLLDFYKHFPVEEFHMYVKVVFSNKLCTALGINSSGAKIFDKKELINDIEILSKEIKTLQLKKKLFTKSNKLIISNKESKIVATHIGSEIYFCKEELEVLRIYMECEHREFLLGEENTNFKLKEWFDFKHLTTLYNRVILKKTIKEISEILNLSISRIRDIENDCRRSCRSVNLINQIFIKSVDENT